MLFPFIAQAQIQILPPGDPAQYQVSDLVLMMGNIIKLAIGLVMFIAIIFVIFGGYRYITAGGNPEQIAQAKASILWAIVGLIIAITSYLVISYVWSKFARIPLPGF